METERCRHRIYGRSRASLSPWCRELPVAPQHGPHAPFQPQTRLASLESRTSGRRRARAAHPGARPVTRSMVSCAAANPPSRNEGRVESEIRVRLRVVADLAGRRHGRRGRSQAEPRRWRRSERTWPVRGIRQADRAGLGARTRLSSKVRAMALRPGSPRHSEGAKTDEERPRTAHAMPDTTPVTVSAAEALRDIWEFTTRPQPFLGCRSGYHQRNGPNARRPIQNTGLG